MKKLFFSFIVFLPLFLFLSLIFSFNFGIYKMRHIDYGKIYLELKEYLEKEKGKVYVSVKDNKMQINYDYYIKGGPYKPSHQQFSFDPSPDDFLIYVYGSSPIISKPPFFKGNFPFFPLVLESELNATGDKRHFRIFNLGMGSFDSFDIKELIKATMSYKAPDLVIYFDAQASDFESAYFVCIKRHFYIISNFFENISHFLSLNRIPGLMTVSKLGGWFLRAYAEPMFINSIQKLNFVKLKKGPFEEYNALIIDYYKRNMYELIESIKAKNIPCVIITPVFNLEARPFGIYNITDRYYKQGLKEKDYSKRIEYLIKAKDSEIFTGDMGFKLQAYNFLVGLKIDGVYILDLLERLEEERFGFDYRYFYDVGHMKPQLHRIIADRLYEFLKDNELLK